MSLPLLRKPTSKTGLVDFHIDGLVNPEVGGDAVADVEMNDVTGHELSCEKVEQLALPHAVTARRDEHSQRLERLLRAIFLDKGDGDDDDDGNGDGNRIIELTQQQRDAGRSQ